MRYFVNEEKGVVVAKMVAHVDNGPQCPNCGGYHGRTRYFESPRYEARNFVCAMVRKTLVKRGYDVRDAYAIAELVVNEKLVAKFVKDEYVGKSACSPEDLANFDLEFGSDLAEVRCAGKYWFDVWSLALHVQETFMALSDASYDRAEKAYAILEDKIDWENDMIESTFEPEEDEGEEEVAPEASPEAVQASAAE